jgi:hypothetical protein
VPALPDLALEVGVDADDHRGRRAGEATCPDARADLVVGGHERVGALAAQVPREAHGLREELRPAGAQVDDADVVVDVGGAATGGLGEDEVDAMAAVGEAAGEPQHDEVRAAAVEGGDVQRDVSRPHSAARPPNTAGRVSTRIFRSRNGLQFST